MFSNNFRKHFEKYVTEILHTIVLVSAVRYNIVQILTDEHNCQFSHLLDRICCFLIGSWEKYISVSSVAILYFNTIKNYCFNPKLLHTNNNFNIKYMAM